MITRDSLTKYFRTSLADQNLIGIERKSKDKSQFSFSLNEMIQGQLASKQTIEDIFSCWKKQNPSSQCPEVLSIVICPLTFNLKGSHGSASQKAPERIVPLLLRAIINREGQFFPPEENYPWINRSVLAPTENGQNVLLATVEEYDQYISKYGDVDIFNEWDSYQKFAFKLFKDITPLEQDYSIKYGSITYTQTEHSFLVLADCEPDAINEGLLYLYDSILDHEDTLLYNKVTEGVSERDKLLSLEQEIDLASQHFGHMQRSYGLGPSQRLALHHFLSTGNGEATTVNGPPGTGKTTLLKSVVASLLVEKAVEGKENSPIIAATSANNQAVTNIIKDFGDIFPEESPTVFEKRWLPSPLKSLGVFAASENKFRPDFHCIKVGGGGFHEGIENEEFVDKAKQKFKSNYTVAFQENTTLEQAIKKLREKCIKATDSLQTKCENIKVLIENEEIISQLSEQANALKQEIGSLEERATEQKKSIELKEQSLSNFTEVLKKIEEFLLQEPFIQTLLASWLSAFATKRAILFRRALEGCELSDQIDDLQSPLEVRKEFQRQVTDLKKEIATWSEDVLSLESSLGEKKEKLKTLTDEINKTQKSVEAFREESGLKRFDRENIYRFLEKLDTTLRYEAFLFAMHYFEGLWILKAKEFLNEDRETWKVCCSPNGLKGVWNRYARLTPCVVSTVYMVPKFFRTLPKEGKKSLFNYLDLLIVDEAGQATPETIACLFSLAKRSIVVGDAYQIEPVWKVPESIDVGNLRKNANVICPDGIVPESAEAFAASCGSAIKMSQRCSKFQESEEKVPGMHLVEHRRCHPQIIEYCKQLVYPDLQPFEIPKDRDKPTALQGWPRMGYAHIPGDSQRVGGSRVNLYEAENVAGWIGSVHDELVNSYQKPIEEIIAVVTPFKAQALAIKKRLPKYRKITVGTVHSLQGAEKPIVLFSPVYGGTDRGLPFIDRKPNILNVAVSRAQHSFLVFGNMNKFSLNGNSPSSLLARHILKPVNEIPINLTPRNFERLEEGVKRIDTLEEHRKELLRAFSVATKGVLIISPVVPEALEADGICDAIAQATKRGAIVEIFIDITFYKAPNVATDCVNTLKSAGASVTIIKNFHSKTLIQDDRVLFEGSFNWLSAPREGEYLRENHSLKYISQDVEKFKKSTLEQLEKATCG